MRRLVFVTVALALAGCSSLTPVERPPGVGGLLPVSKNQAPDSSRANATGPIPVPGPVTVRSVPADSTPTADAREVLATIPEPLPPGERVPAPVVDSTAVETAEGDVPTPAPTQPLGDAPPPIETGAPSTPVTTPGTTTTPAQPDTCWRVQVGAPVTSEEAEAKRNAAESLLITSFVVEQDRGLYKVRSKDCVSRQTALVLRDRALQSGFNGAFPIAIVRQ